MKSKIHLIAAITGTLCISVFLVSTVLVELFGSAEAIRTVKSLIVSPGLFILVPAMAVAGITGNLLGKGRTAGLVGAKRKRMPFIAANGLLILVPSAIFLDQWAAAYNFGTAFYAVQGLELVMGSVNLTLMGMNMRDGLKMKGRLRRVK